MRNPAPILLALLLSLASRGGAQQLATKFTEVEGITEYRLPNGLRVLLFPEYNTERPHRGLGQRTPSEYAAVYGTTRANNQTQSYDANWRSVGGNVNMAYGYRDDAYFFLKIRVAFPGIS